MRCSSGSCSTLLAIVRTGRAEMGEIIRQRMPQGRPVGLPSSHAGDPMLGPVKTASAAMPTPQFEAAAVAAVAPHAAAVVKASDAEHERRLADAIEQATQKGFERGFQQGSEAAQEEYETRLRAIGELLASCRNEVTARLEKLDDDLVELVFVAITRIIGRTQQTREGVLATIESVLQERREEASRLIVRISAANWEMLGEEGRRQLCGDARTIELVVDGNVELGGCLIEVDRGTVDGRLETQLAKLKQALVDSHVSRRS
jgi:flagellar assembly protein FliH